MYSLPSQEDLIKIGMNLEESETFSRIHAEYAKLKSHHSEYMAWDKVSPVSDSFYLKWNSLPDVPKDKAAELLKKVVVIKLNGGLGTRMGMTSPKSTLETRNDLSFLDLTVRQIEWWNKTYGVDIPLALMNSFSTHSTTKKSIIKYKKNKLNIFLFKQGKFPRLYKETLRPIPVSIAKKEKQEKEEKHAWVPPGSGDVFQAFSRSGLLDQFIEQGKEYVFISSVENLGATIDLKILAHAVKNQDEYVLEMTERLASDTNGGLLVQEDGKIKLLEVAQIPSSKLDLFQAGDYHYWNTNSMWTNLQALKKLISDNKLKLGFISNSREVDGQRIVQLEMTAGSIVSCFTHPRAVIVPRDRFRPVKNTSSLFLLQSNLFDLKEDGTLVMSPLRMFPSMPVVKLGEHFHHINDYSSRFKQIPDVLELDHLTVSGDVTFGTGVSLKGTVIIVANKGDKINIPSGAVLENKIISGSLNLVDH